MWGQRATPPKSRLFLEGGKHTKERRLELRCTYKVLTHAWVYLYYYLN